MAGTEKENRDVKMNENKGVAKLIQVMTGKHKERQEEFKFKKNEN